MQEETAIGLHSTDILHKPRLNSLRTLFNELKKPVGTGDDLTYWYDLGKRNLKRADVNEPAKDTYEIEDYKNGLDFVNQVHEEVRRFVSEKIPAVKNKVKSLKEFDDNAMVDALVNNWIEESLPQIGEKRKEILTLVGAHVVRWIETKAVENVLEGSSPEQLSRLGLTPLYKNILVDVLKASRKSDPLFIRFHAFGQLTGDAPKNASNLNISLDGKKHTYTSLFSHDNLGMANQFEEISQKIDNEAYGNKPDNVRDHTQETLFKSYIDSLVDFYRNVDPKRSRPLYSSLTSKYKKLIDTDFPIIITPPTDTLFHEPYYDPEMRVSLRTPDAANESALYKKARESMSKAIADGSLTGLHRKEEAGKNILDAKPYSVVSVGNFGANLLLNGVAQETPKPYILLFLNDQIRAYDDDFPEKMHAITNTKEAFSGLSENESGKLKKRMSRMATILHEYAHYIYPDDDQEAQKMGDRPLTAIDEVKAETVFKALVPSMLENGGLEGTKDQWASAVLTSALQLLIDQDESDTYGFATCFAVNEAFKSGAVTLSESGVTITNADAFFDGMKNASEKVIGLYQDKKMNPEKASKWIKDNCFPISQVEDLKTYLQSRDW